MRIAILDLETTGLLPDAQPAGIVEVAVRLVRFDQRGSIVLDSYESLNDPGFPIPAEAAEVNHITDAMVAGKQLSAKSVAHIVSIADLVVAHHAAFDRSFFEPFISTVPARWGCSKQHIDWNALRMPCRHLAHLAFEHNIRPMNRHRAMGDVDTLLALLKTSNPLTGQPYWQELSEAALEPHSLVLATGAPFASKDLLRTNGFTWGPGRKCWWRAVRQSQMLAVSALLHDEVYGRRNACQRVDGWQRIDDVDPLAPDFAKRYQLQ